MRRLESLDSNPDKTNPGPLQPKGIKQTPGRVVEILGHVDRTGHRFGAGDRREVGESDLQLDSATHLPGQAQSAAHLIGKLQQMRMNSLCIIDVVIEGLLGTNALLRLARIHPPGIPAPGELVQVPARRLAKHPLQGRHRGARNIADRTQA